MLKLLMRKIALFLLILSSVSAFSPRITKAAGISVFYNGVEIKFDVPPTVISGRAMVPLRALFEAMDVEFAWNNDDKTVSFYKGMLPLRTITVGKTVAHIVGLPDAHLDVPPTIINGRVLIPLRFVAEQLNKNVAFDEKNQIIQISERIKDNVYTDLANGISFEIAPNMDMDFLCHNLDAMDAASQAEVLFVDMGFSGSDPVPAVQEVYKFRTPSDLTINALLTKNGAFGGNEKIALTSHDEKAGIYSGVTVLGDAPRQFTYKFTVYVKSIGRYTYEAIIAYDENRRQFDETEILRLLRTVNEAK